MTTFTVINDDGTEVEVDAQIDGERVRFDLSALETSLGWSAKPEGLCRGDVCVPVEADLVTEGMVDLRAVAAALRAPIAIDDSGVAAVGEAASLHAQALASDVAPDFTLESVAGGAFTFSSLRGRKRLLVAWASW